MRNKTVNVKQNEEKPVAVEVLAESIVAISKGIKKLRAGPLNDKCLTLLIQHAAPSIGYNRRVGATEVRAVLDGIQDLERVYIRKAKQ